MNSSFWTFFLLLIIFTFVAYLSYSKMRSSNRKGWQALLTLRLTIFGILLLLVADLNFSQNLILRKVPEIRIYFDNSVSVAHHPSLSPDVLRIGYEEIVAAVQKKSVESPGDVLIKLHSFGSEVRDLSSVIDNIDFLEPSTNLSAIFEKEEEGFTDSYLSGIILVTDGQVTSGIKPTNVDPGLEVPIHVVGVGELTPMVDIHLERIKAPTVAVRGEQVTVEAIVSAVGDFHEKVHVTLRKAKEVLGTKTITISGDGSLRSVRFQFQLNELGENKYNVQVSSLRRETNIENNHSSFRINVLRDHFRVALITGAASPNTSILKQILESEEKFNIDHYIRMKAGWSIPIALFWRTEYDLIVLDNAPSNNMSSRWAADLRKKLSRENSALVFVAGPSTNDQQLKEILVLLGLQESHGENVGIEGRPIFYHNAFMHPVFSGFAAQFETLSLPPLSLTVSAEPKTNSVKVALILEGTSTMPLFTLGFTRDNDNSINRRVAAFLSKELWSLYFKTLRLDEHQFITIWWKRLFNWLAGTTGEETLYFRLNKSNFQHGEPVVVLGTVLSLDETAPYTLQVMMTVSGESGSESIPLIYEKNENQWQGRFHAFKPGEYQYVISVVQEGKIQQQTSGYFSVVESQVELNRVYLAQQILETLAFQSGGSYYSWAQRKEVVNNLELSPREDVFTTTKNLSHQIQFLIVILILLTLEWILRRRWGLQ